MAYYFMVEKKRSLYQPLNIAASKYFQTIPKYKIPCALSLKEIDDFTMLFNNEYELRRALVSEGILSIESSAKSLSARYLNSGKYIKVEYDFLYQKDMEYVYDPTKLIELIMKRYYNNELSFIRDLAFKFSRVRKCGITASEVANLCQSSISHGEKHRGLEEVDKNGNIPILRLLKLIILKSYETPSGYIEYKNEVEYRNLHDLIAFINNYDEKNIVPSNGEKKDFGEKIGGKMVTSAKTSVKTRKKDYVLDGQLKFDV